MSHSRVRSEIKQALTAWGQAQAQPVAFIDTINRNDKPPAGNWTTAQFFAAAVQPVCYAWAKREETGNVDVFVFTRAGAGDTEAAALADALGDHFINLDLSAAGIEITGILPASETFAGDANGRHFGVVVSLDYRYLY